MPRLPSTTAVLVALLVASFATPAGGTTSSSPTGAPVAADCATGVAGGTASDGASVTGGENGADASATTLVAPGSAYERLRNASTLSTAADRGLLVPASLDAYARDPRFDAVAERDVAVHRVELSGTATRLLDRLAARGQGSPTENFVSLVRRDGVEFRYVGPSMCPPPFRLAESVERGAFRVVPDERDGTLYLLLDVDDLAFADDGWARQDWTLGHHGLRLEISASSGLVDEAVAVEDDYIVVEEVATFTRSGDDATLSLDAAPNRTVGGLTTLAAGRELAVTLRLADGRTENRTATVHAHPDVPDVYRHYHAMFDLSGVPDGTAFRVAVHANGSLVGETTGEVVARSASVRLPASERWDDGVVVVENVTLSHGGFVRVTAGGDLTLGHSGYLPAGDHRNVTVDVDTTRLPELPTAARDTVVVFVHADTDGDRTFDRRAVGTDGRYVVDGHAVSDEAPIASPTPSPTPTPAPPTATAATPTPTPSTVSGPGMLLALLAVAVVVVAARRRR